MIVLDKNVLKQIIILKNDINKIIDVYNSNNKLLDILKKDKKVLKVINLIEENNNIVLEKNKINTNINLLINKNCNHDLLLYKNYNYDMYDNWYEYICLECGKLIESTSKLKNVIYSEISYDKLRKEYFNYLYKYDEKISIELMLLKYNNHLYNELVNEGLNEIKALKLIKKGII